MKDGGRWSSWSNFTLPASCSSAGSWDATTDELYIRTYGELGFMVVDTTTDTVVRTITDTESVGENSRTGFFLRGDFYSRIWDGALQRFDGVSGARSDTAATPTSGHTGTYADALTGLAYISGYGADSTVFERFDPRDNSIVPLADSPNVSNHSTVAVVHHAVGCSEMATFQMMLEPDVWICAYNNERDKTWPQTYGVCNEADGYYLASVGPFTERGLPDDANILRALSATADNGHDYITTGQPTRSCAWDSSVTDYEMINGLGYVHTSQTTGAEPDWQQLVDGNNAEMRPWRAANDTGAHPLASMCMQAWQVGDSVVYDHRWR